MQNSNKTRTNSARKYILSECLERGRKKKRIPQYVWKGIRHYYKCIFGTCKEPTKCEVSINSAQSYISPDSLKRARKRGNYSHPYKKSKKPIHYYETYR